MPHLIYNLRYFIPNSGLQRGKFSMYSYFYCNYKPIPSSIIQLSYQLGPRLNRICIRKFHIVCFRIPIFITVAKTGRSMLPKLGIDLPKGYRPYLNGETIRIEIYIFVSRTVVICHMHEPSPNLQIVLKWSAKPNPSDQSKRLPLNVDKAPCNVPPQTHKNYVRQYVTCHPPQ